MKRIIALLLTLSLFAAMFAACGSAGSDDWNGKPAAPYTDIPAGDTKAPVQTKAPEKPQPPVSDENGITTDPAALSDRSDIAYLMVYNPDFADDAHSYNGIISNWIIDKRNTGDISAQVDVDMDRADDLPPIMDFNWLSQGDLQAEMPEGLKFDSDRAGGLPSIYKVGDVHAFYTDNASFSDRTLQNYTCRYDGSHCYVWVNENAVLSDDLAERYGKAFDEQIYDADTRLFGQGRFTDGGGKVNILFYDIVRSYYGYFSGRDIFSVLDASDPSVFDANKMNTDHAIIFINAAIARMPDQEDSIISTLAHEFQHQICASSRIDALYCDVDATVDTWFNEAMSGYIEEYLFPGIQAKDGRYAALHTSQTLRTGQSLYNFDTQEGIGAYGSVFLFASYLANLAGEGVFHRFHDYWRYSASPTLSTAEAIYNAVGEDVRRAIDEKYPYTSIQGVSTTEELWMSKLVLDYYVTQMNFDASDPEAFRGIEPKQLLFNSLYPSSLDLESGGRTVFAVNNGSFTIPADARDGLIYVALDRDMNPLGTVVLH